MTTLARFARVEPGHDCYHFPCGKGDCGRTPGGNHGVRDDCWHFAVSDGAVALSFWVFSGIYPDTVEGRQSHNLQRAGIMHVHRSLPFDEEQVRSGYDGAPCDYLPGGCFANDGTALGARDFLAELGARFWEPEKFWQALEVEWDSLQKPPPLSVKRCSRCDGAGLVDVSLTGEGEGPRPALGFDGGTLLIIRKARDLAEAGNPGAFFLLNAYLEERERREVERHEDPSLEDGAPPQTPHQG